VLNSVWATDAIEGIELFCFYFKVFLLVPDGKASRCHLFRLLPIQQTKPELNDRNMFSGTRF